MVYCTVFTTWCIVLFLQHGVAYDMTFNGYTMPKGATVLTFLETALNDPKTWGDPLTFRPERFIGPDGKLTRPDEFIPFSIGNLKFWAIKCFPLFCIIFKQNLKYQSSNDYYCERLLSMTV